ncbi:MAG: SUMF1/EgtB/PvdO family nonheme iron enzyme [Pirellulales bacterium]
MLVIILGAARVATAVSIETVPVGNPGNGPDPRWVDTLASLGPVDYEYRIGKYEVTNAQYAEFLNAKAASDPLFLYDFHMGSNLVGGIIRDGVGDSYTYTVKPNMANKPVNYVSLWNAQRFANWMHNGQGSGSTETGSYTMGGTLHPPNAPAAFQRNVGATWVLPTEHEWYKAAYYDPRTAAEGGPPDDSHYWLYPTRSNDAPNKATANSVGDISNPGANVANYGGGANWNGSSGGNVTTIGSAGPQSVSFYGTYDQAGNVGEWNRRSTGQSTNGLGGAFIESGFDDVGFLTAIARNVAPISNFGPSVRLEYVGFRLAYVPEPSSLALAVVGFTALGVWRWRTRRE